MDLKAQVLEALERDKGAYISGNELAEKLYVSRNAVWKAIKSLKDEGHQIMAVTNRGYCLAPDSGILSKASIDKHLGARGGTFSVEVFKTLNSTNTYLKERASHGAPEGTVVVSEEQSGGRGRLGRGFFSPAGTGVYFSIVLRPPLKALDATLVTTAAAVAVAESIEAVTGVPAKIKWVNDVFCHGKKVCGILTEGSFDMESGGLEYVVLGIGVNVMKPETGYPGEITGVASAILDAVVAEADVRSRLIAEILKKFWDYYEHLTDKVYLKEYKARSFIIGHPVDVVAGSMTRKAQVLDIDDDCRLVVQYEDSRIETLSTGEVSIRPITL